MGKNLEKCTMQFVTLCILWIFTFSWKEYIMFWYILCRNKNVVLTFDNGMTKQKVYNNRRMQEMENVFWCIQSWLLMHIPKYEVENGPVFIILFFTLDRDPKVRVIYVVTTQHNMLHIILVVGKNVESWCWCTCHSFMCIVWTPWNGTKNPGKRILGEIAHHDVGLGLELRKWKGKQNIQNCF